MPFLNYLRGVSKSRLCGQIWSLGRHFWQTECKFWHENTIVSLIITTHLAHARSLKILDSGSSIIGGSTSTSWIHIGWWTTVLSSICSISFSSEDFFFVSWHSLNWVIDNFSRVLVISFTISSLLCWSRICNTQTQRNQTVEAIVGHLFDLLPNNQ